MSLSEVCEEHNCVIIIKMPHFSDIVPYQLSTEKQVSCHHDAFLDEHYSVQVYANGTEKAENDEGYVSAVFTKPKQRFRSFDTHYELSFVIGVLDASGQKMFPMSYVFHPSNRSSVMTKTHYGPFMLYRVAKRDALLSEPGDLLTDDCLTLHIDVIFRRWSYEPLIGLEDLVTQAFEYDNHNNLVILHMDSKLGKHLIDESPYFRTMSQTPVVENKRGYKVFSLMDYAVFLQICYILEGVKSIRFFSADDLLDIYIVADRYDIPSVIESCRGLLSTVLRAAENDPVIIEQWSIANLVPRLSHLADTCNDVRLKKIVESFLQRTSGGGIKDTETTDSTRDCSYTEWRLLKLGDHVESGGELVFARGTPEERNFDFYQ